MAVRVPRTSNVTVHMWACRYGVALFEDRVNRGLNHNLLIEVGAMLMTGRRCAFLKDGSIERMPTDFIGMIYKSVDLSAEDTVAATVRTWLNEDLGIGGLYPHRDLGTRSRPLRRGAAPGRVPCGPHTLSHATAWEHAT